MADISLYVRDPETGQLIPLKAYDNGDGTYSLSGTGSGGDALQSTSVAIKAKTDLIPADNVTQLDTNIPAIKTKTDTIPTSPTGAADIAVPTADVATNVKERDVIGNKSDAAVTTVGAVASILAYIKGLLNQVATLVTNTAVTVAGRLQEKATTIDLNQAAATYDLFTGTTQVVVLQSLVFRCSGGSVAGALTSISIQTNDATPQIITDSTIGDVSNLTNEAQLSWNAAVGGPIYIKVGKKIQLTIAGGAAGVARVCDVVAEYRSVVSGGTLA